MKKVTLVLVMFLVSFTMVNAQKTATYDEVINKTKKGKISTYTSKEGEVFNVGDEIIIGQPNSGNFKYVKSAFGYVGSTPDYGITMVITKMNIYNKHVFIKATGDSFKITETSLQKSLDNNEIQSQLVTEADIIEELKIWRDKLELEIITQEEYDKVKAELLLKLQ